MKLNIKKINPIVLLLIAFSVLLLLSALIFYITYYHPGSLLTTSPKFISQQVYRFEPWKFTFNDLNFNYPEGGIIIPAFHNGEQWGIYIAAEGTLNSPGGQTELSGMFLVIQPGQLDAMKGGTLFAPVDDHTLFRQYTRLLQQVKYPRASLFGFDTSILPAAEEYILLGYSSGCNCKTIFHLPTLTFTGFYYLLSILLLMTLAYIITLDIFTPERNSSRIYPWNEQEKYILPIILLLTVLTQTLFLGFWGTVGYACIVICLLLFKRRGILPPINFGVKFSYLFRSLFTGIIISVLFLLFIAPFSKTDICIPTGYSFVLPALAGLLNSFFYELIYRGYIQSTFERLLGQTKGLLTASAILITVQYAAVIIITGNTFPLSQISLLTTLLGLHFVTGFIYQQGENIAGPVIIHWILMYLPPLFIK